MLLHLLSHQTLLCTEDAILGKSRISVTSALQRLPDHQVSLCTEGDTQGRNRIVTYVIQHLLIYLTSLCIEDGIQTGGKPYKCSLICVDPYSHSYHA